MIRIPAVDEYEQWKSLWDGYLLFYETERTEEKAASLWRRIHDQSDPINGLVYEHEGRLVGMTNFFAHPDTWSEQPRCYLQDLFVEEDVRGNGIGRQLIDSVADFARSHGCGDVYWMTAEDNQSARILYDGVTGGASGFIIYEFDV